MTEFNNIEAGLILSPSIEPDLVSKKEQRMAKDKGKKKKKKKNTRQEKTKEPSTSQAVKTIAT